MRQAKLDDLAWLSPSFIGPANYILALRMSFKSYIMTPREDYVVLR